MSDSQNKATQEILETFSEAERPTAAKVLPVVYQELRAVAEIWLSRERAGHTLQPTALVHEAYLRLAEQERAQFHDRAHFLSLASRVMRRILVDHARARGRAKRGSGWQRLTLSGVGTDGGEHPIDLLALEDALVKLAAKSERTARVVEMRFFGGLTNDEVADVIGIARSTVAEEWRFAKAWLGRELGEA